MSGTLYLKKQNPTTFSRLLLRKESSEQFSFSVSGWAGILAMIIVYLIHRILSAVWKILIQLLTATGTQQK